MKSQQVVQHGANLEAREIATPAPEGTQVLVRVDSCGVCHSDVHLWEGFFDLGGGQKVDLTRRPTPFTLGHEVGGEVVAVGPDAEGVELGARRVVYPWIGCGGCAICERGEEQLCLQSPSIGVAVDGGYSDHVLVPHARYLFEYGSVAPELACTYACSGLTAYGALAKSKQRAQGRNLLIVGAGGVGMAGLAFARAVLSDDTNILVADIDDAKLEAAKKAGATQVLRSDDADAVKAVRKLTAGGAAAAIDFVGAESSARFAVDALGRGGQLVMVGLFGGALTLSLPVFALKQISIAGTYTGSPQEMAEMMELVRSGRVPPIPVETRPLADASRTLEELRDGQIVGRVVLTP